MWFYVRGEEYSAQIDHFVQCIKTGSTAITTFRTASDTVLVAAKLRQDSAQARTAVKLTAAADMPGAQAAANRPKSFMRSILGRF